MKPVRLRHDGPSTIYMVPDSVAANLREYCDTFCEWLQDSPEAIKLYIGGDISFGVPDFIEYLNTYIFPEQPSYPVEGLEPILDNSDLPREYRVIPYFAF